MKQFTQSTIGAYLGPKRSGKSESLAAATVWKLCNHETVWSEMKICTGPAILARHTFMDGSPIVYRETLPLNLDKFLMLDPEIHDGTVDLDEVGYYDGAQGHMSNKNRLTNACIRQAGHRNLDLLYTERSWRRVDPYLREETDFVCDCFDLRFSPWGMDNHLAGGVVIRQRYFDVSGAITGHPVDYFSPRAKPYKVQLFYGTPYQECYDTRQLISIEEGFTNVQLDMKKRLISNKPDEDYMREAVALALEDLAVNNDEVPGDKLWEFLHSRGIEGSPNTLGRYIPHDIKRRSLRNVGVMYELDSLKVTAAPSAL